jgi:hypothetical protein
MATRTDLQSNELQNTVLRAMIQAAKVSLAARVSFETSSIRNIRNWNQSFGTLQYNVCFGCFASTPKQIFDVSIEPKQTEDPPQTV